MFYRYTIIFCLAIFGCTHEPLIYTADYPPDIGKIMITKCATNGCHNTISAAGAEGVDLSTWEKMMNGRELGATVIPYSHSQSLLYLYINSFSDLGAIVTPTMPKGGTPLSREEVLKIRSWITAGAPNKDGYVKWSENPQRRKYYIANRGCDIVASIDPSSSLVMRYIDVGHVFEIEKPCNVKVSPDHLHWYVSFANSDILQQFSTSEDKKTGELIIGYGNWTSMCITANSKIAFLINTDSIQSELAIVNLESMTLIKKYSTPLLGFAINLSLNEQNKVLFIGSEKGNFFYKADITDPLHITFTQIPVQTGIVPDINGIDNPSAACVDPNTNRIYVACTGTGQLCEFDANTNQLLNHLFVGYTPQNIVFDPFRNYLYVACSDDSLTLPGKHGYIAVVDALSYSIVQQISTEEVQPYGMVIDNLLNRLIVTNRNFSNTGPPPHHHVECDGRVGSFSAIDLNTLSLINGEGYYLSVEPYSVDVRN